MDGSDQAILPAGQPELPWPLPRHVQRLLLPRELLLAAQDTERSLTINMDGRRVGRGEGNLFETTAFIPADQAVDCIVTHNHPLGLTFSPTDLQTTIRSGIYEMRAVFFDGDRLNVYRVQRPPMGWPSLDRLAATLDRWQATDAYLRRRDIGWSERDRQHEWMNRVAAHLALRYSWERGAPDER